MIDACTQLLEEVLEAHGGHSKWSRFEGVASTIRTGGKLWELKGAPIIPVPRRATTTFHRQWTRVKPFGEPDWTMTWTPERVSIESDAGALIAQRENGRDAFDRSFNGQWDPLNLAYFNGYAMWTYHAVPFVFGEPGFEAAEIDSIDHEGEELRGLRVRFPQAVHSHTREQSFYFGQDGLLKRHDYTVDVWADTPAAHIVSEYIEVEGLMYPTKRRVYAITEAGVVDTGFNAVSIDLSEYKFF